MNLFLKVTAIFEAITGLVLILFPKMVLELLFLSVTKETGAIMMAMIAGAALLSIAFLCVLTTEKSKIYSLIQTLLFYNIIVVAIALYGIIHLSIQGFGVKLIICFHSLLALWSLLIFRKAN